MIDTQRASTQMSTEILIDFDATTVTPSSGGSTRDPIPAGEYPAVVERWKTFTNEDGSVVLQTSFKLTADGGEHSGKWVREKYMVKSTSPDHAKRVANGKARLAALLVACGMPTERNIAATEGSEVTIKVGIMAASGQYAARNVIDGVSAPSGAVPVAAAPTAAKKAPGFMSKPRLA